MMKLLLIEDDARIALALSQALATTSLLTRSTNGLEGMRRALFDNFDVIILDLALPDMSGLQVCETLRASGCKTPILILTGESQVLTKIRLLDAGANDYLTKPFSLGELKARLRVLQRQPITLPEIRKQLQIGELVLDANTYQVSRDGQVINLRRKEFALLECLMRHPGQVVSRTVLGNYAWQDGEQPWANTIDVHIKYLRDKIDRPFAKQLIQTIHGLGYKLDTSPTLIAGKR